MKQTQCSKQTGLVAKPIEHTTIDVSTAETARLKHRAKLQLRVLTSTSILVLVLELNVTPQVATVLLFVAVDTHKNTTKAA